MAACVLCQPGDRRIVNACKAIQQRPSVHGDGLHIVTGAMGIDGNRPFMIPAIYVRQTPPPPGQSPQADAGAANETGASEGFDGNASDGAPAGADGGEGTVFQVGDSATFGGALPSAPGECGG